VKPGLTASQPARHQTTCFLDGLGDRLAEILEDEEEPITYAGQFQE